MFVSSKCCVLYGRVLCDGPNTRPEESYHVLIRQTEHDLESLKIRRPRTNMASAAIKMAYIRLFPSL
jgi:hypothetical protein